LHDPALSWVKLAEGMGVEAVQVDGTAGLADAFRSAMSGRGPRLIEALI
jgi:acetolactate synthase-1/2/3 large subunit